jgi:hypothetical protein
LVGRVFSRETPDFALQRHRELRPDRAGRPVRFEQRNVSRAELAETLATHTSDELQALMDRIEANGRGEHVLADAHGGPWAGTSGLRATASIGKVTR